MYNNKIDVQILRNVRFLKHRSSINFFLWKQKENRDETFESINCMFEYQVFRWGCVYISKKRVKSLLANRDYSSSTAKSCALPWFESDCDQTVKIGSISYWIYETCLDYKINERCACTVLEFHLNQRRRVGKYVPLPIEVKMTKLNSYISC